MTNADELSELIRTGSLDFALLKPIDTQFLVSLRRIDWSSLANFVFGLALLALFAGPAALPARAGCDACSIPFYVALRRGDLLQPDDRPGGGQRVDGPEPDALRFLVLHHHVLPLSDGDLSRAGGHAAAAGRSRSSFRCWWWSTCRRGCWCGRCCPRRRQDWLLPPFALLATAASLAVSRWVFQRALESYRSASS